MEINKSERTSKSKTYCCVPHCKTYYEQNVSFHVFPKNEKLRKQWIKVLKIKKPVSCHMRVCSKHFLNADFFYQKAVSRKRYALKQGVVPSQNLLTKSKIELLTQDKEKPELKKNNRKLTSSKIGNSLLENNRDPMALLYATNTNKLNYCSAEDVEVAQILLNISRKFTNVNKAKPVINP